MLLHVPLLAERIERLGAYLRYETHLDRDIAELAVLVTAHACRSRFEWEAHEPLAVAAGVPEDVIRLVRLGADSGHVDPRHRAAVDYARELASTGAVSDQTYGAAIDLVGTVGIVELTVLVGYYAMLATTMSAHGVEGPDAGSLFGPDV